MDITGPLGSAPVPTAARAVLSGSFSTCAETMLSDLYLIPRLLGQEVAEYDMWHSSSDQSIDYFAYLPDEVAAAITAAEHQWLGQAHDSTELCRIRQRHIEIYHKLRSTKDVAQRSALLSEADALLDGLRSDRSDGS